MLCRALLCALCGSKSPSHLYTVDIPLYHDPNKDKDIGYYAKDRVLDLNQRLDKDLLELMTTFPGDCLQTFAENKLEGLLRDEAWQYGGGNGLAGMHWEDGALHFSNDMIALRFPETWTAELGVSELDFNLIKCVGCFGLHAKCVQLALYPCGPFGHAAHSAVHHVVLAAHAAAQGAVPDLCEDLDLCANHPGGL